MQVARVDGDVLAAFSEEQVERLTGLSVAQLRYWDRTDFFRPSLADENRRLAYSRIYSFKDVVALRTLSVLRRQFSVPLQRLRKVKDKLAHLSDDLWSKTILYVLDRKVYFQEGEDGAISDVLSGQYTLGIPLEKIVTDTKRDVRELHARPAAKVGRIERSRYVSHNAWVIAGTRVPVAAIRRFKEAGYSIDEIVGEYPGLTRRDVEAALAHQEERSTAA